MVPSLTDLMEKERLQNLGAAILKRKERGYMTAVFRASK